MPRLPGYRERIDYTAYDAFSPKDMLNCLEGVDKAPAIRLFGNRNIGNPALTNLLTGNFIGGGDQTFAILTWYARTNVSDACLPRRAWDAWINATTVTLAIGTRPIRDVPLAHLLGPRTFGNACGQPSGALHEDDEIDRLACRMFGNFAAQQSLEVRNNTYLKFADLPRGEQDRWRAAASVYPFRHPVILPRRQTIAVSLRSDAAALNDLLRVLPENIAPRPLVWVHLDGSLTRDLA